jgi:2-polyprenyl-3-methyl-5-hydroxy-6-metoxy-1,4-benzoquinol methylase
MSDYDKWEQRYQSETYVFGFEPSELVRDYNDLLKPKSRILAVGDGEGRNAIWLAQHGHDVTIVDIAPSALGKAEQRALNEGTRLKTICVDITKWQWPRHEFDAVLSIFVHLLPQHQLVYHDNLINTLKPDGLLFFEAYHPDNVAMNSRGPRDAAMLYDTEKLNVCFKKLQTCVNRYVDTSIRTETDQKINGRSVQYLGRRKLKN